MKGIRPQKRNLLISERSLNYILRPVQVRRANYPYTYEVKNMGKSVSVTVDRAWTPMKHLVLDMIGHDIYERIYEKVHDNRNTWKNTLSSNLLMNANVFIKNYNSIGHSNQKSQIARYVNYTNLITDANVIKSKLDSNQLKDDEKNELKKKLISIEKMLNYLLTKMSDSSISELNRLNLDMSGNLKRWSVSIEPDKIAQRYKTFFSKRRKEYIQSIIENISKTNLSLEYPLRAPVICEDMSENHEVNRKIKAVYTELLKIDNESIFEVEKDTKGIVLHFDSLLGRAYVHNILTLNTDWFKETMLQLNGYASAIYRRFFLLTKQKYPQSLLMNDIIEFFGFRTNTNYKKSVLEAFENIKSVGIISDFDIEYFGNQFSKSRINISKSSK